MLSVAMLAVFVGTTINVEANSIASQLKGRILIQSQAGQQVWYVDPGSDERYRLNSLEDLNFVIENLGLQVSDDYIIKYLVFPQNVWGKFLVVIDNSNARKVYYIYPVDGKAYLIINDDKVLSTMKSFGLSILNENLNKIKISDLDRSKVK